MAPGIGQVFSDSSIPQDAWSPLNDTLVATGIPWQ
jgi:hypothetical protein